MATARSRIGARRGSRTDPSDPSCDFGLPEDIAADTDADPESTARTICLRLLTVRSRTRTELEDALAARGVPADAGTAVIDRLAAVGLVDDRAFAEQFVRTRVADRGLAPREIVRQLRTKGVDADVAAEAVDHIDHDDELDTARALVTRKLQSMQRLDDAAKSRRLVGLLARKGYSSGLAYRVVREVIAEDSISFQPGE